MESFKRGKVTASVILDERKPKNNSLYPVKIRVIFNRKATYYGCMDLSKEDWQSLEVTRKKELISKRESILIDFRRITSILTELIDAGMFSIDGLNMRLSRGTKDSVIDAFAAKVEELTQSNHLGSAQWYNCAMQSIKKYVNGDLTFASVTPDWLKKYETHLLSENKAYTTIGINMRALRAILNQAKVAGVITQAQYPFVVYKIPEGSGRKIALNIDQLNAVFDYPILPENEIWRDLWIFSFYCNGINISDLLRLKFKDIEDGEISWFRGKTISTDRHKKKVQATITEEMQGIIDRYRNKDHRPEAFIFPFLEHAKTALEQRKIVQNVCHTINKKMKIIGKGLGIENLTTYSARHSFATVLKRGGANLASISESMGHNSLSTTELYFASFGKDERIKNSNMLPKRNKI